MTLLAQKRPGGGQQTFMVGAMGRMAIHAAFAYRSMVKNKRPAFLCMARVTHIVDRKLFQQGIRRTAMWIMAVATRHLALEQRHMRSLTEFNALLLVTAKAGVVNRLSG